MLEPTLHLRGKSTDDRESGRASICEKGSPKKKKSSLEFETTSFPTDGLAKLDITLSSNATAWSCFAFKWNALFWMDKCHNCISKFMLNDNMTCSFLEFKRCHLKLKWFLPLSVFLPASVASMLDYLYFLSLKIRGKLFLFIGSFGCFILEVYISWWSCQTKPWPFGQSHCYFCWFFMR